MDEKCLFIFSSQYRNIVRKNIVCEKRLNYLSDRHDVLRLLHGRHELREVHQDLPPLPTSPMFLHNQRKFQVSQNKFTIEIG